MKSPRIALVHALPIAMDPIKEAFRRLWPEARITNLLDDSLAPDLAADGALTPQMVKRFVTLAHYCVDQGANAILFTCSAFGPAIEAAARAVAVPVLKPNEAMMEDALAAGGKIGLLATFEPSIPSMKAELYAMADARSLKPEFRTLAVPAALARLAEGDAEGHDALIAENARSLAGCDVIMLAQFSMASAAPRVCKTVPGARVLTSPDSAIARLKRALA